MLQALRTGERRFRPTPSEDVQGAGAIKTWKEEAWAVHLRWRVGIEWPVEMTWLFRAKRRPINRECCGCRSYPFKRLSRFTMESMTAPNAGYCVVVLREIGEHIVVRYPRRSFPEWQLRGRGQAD